MNSDDGLRELTAATFKLASAITDVAARVSPTAGMSAGDLQELADRQRLREPPAFDPNTHQGRVEQKIRKALAMQYGIEA